MSLKSGQVVYGDSFSGDDIFQLREIYNLWLKINGLLKGLEGRGINVPDVLSEGVYCYYFNAVRTNNTAYSYDAVSIDTGEGIQIKSTSIKNDLTSFGPKSTWDKLVFVDFFPGEFINGDIWVYEIASDINSLILNKEKNETFEMQQQQGRRPRMSIKKDIIFKEGLEPVKKINLLR